MSYPNSNPIPPSDLPASSGFNAQTQMGLPEVLQMCCQSRRSGQITFRSGESYGFIYLQHGRVLHALCGQTDGEEAVYRMLTWPGGGFSLDEDILPHKKSVNLTWEQLLFEGARRADHGVTGPNGVTGAPVTTKEPATTRMQDSEPRLIVTRPDLAPITFALDQEYTHAGRAPGNEISLPYPSVSNRHCIFILSGPEIVLRDLNSSNGTLVNGEAISEVVLRPGDQIQIGVVHIKFEPGIKRPKLGASVPPRRDDGEALPAETAASGAMYHATVKLPNRPGRDPSGNKVKDDSAFVKGESAISYEHLAKPEEEKSSATMLIIALIAALALAGAAGYYFFFGH